MPKEPESPPAASKLWSRRKILLIFLAPPLLFLAFLLIYDERLEPAPDLVPSHPGTALSARTNGLAMLRAAWNPLPETASADLYRWSDTYWGKYLWDDALVTRLNPSGRDLRQDLTDALNAPEWMDDLVTVRDFLDSKRVLPGSCFRAMTASAMQKARAGDRREAISLVRDLRRMAARQFQGSWSWGGFFFATLRTAEAADLTCNLVAAGGVGATELAELASIWEPEDLTRNDFANPAAGEARFLSEMMTDDAAREYRFGFWERHGEIRPSISNGWLRRYFGLMIRPNATLNQSNRVIRSVRDNALATSFNREASLTAYLLRSFPAKEHWSQLLDSNVGGKLFLYHYSTTFSLYVEQASRGHLFTIRAMRLWLALRRWQQTHEGNLPVLLTELIPDYVTIIPADPWDGSPLRWDAAGKMIYGVGTDWKPDAPLASDLKGRWIATKSESSFDFPSVVLRYELPPPTSPPVAYPTPRPPASKKTPAPAGAAPK